MSEDIPMYGATQAITLRQHLMNNLEQEHYTHAQMREMLLVAVSSCSHYWDLDHIHEASKKAGTDNHSDSIT